MARIVAIDDEQAILAALTRVLERDGHEVVGVAESASVLGMDLSRFDLILCDVMMPGLDGFDLVRIIRSRFDGPIVFLTAKVAEEDAVVGYGLGADDYVRKPFGAAELRAKVSAHLRRDRREPAHVLVFETIRVNLGAKEVVVDGAPVPLTPTEYGICELLARRRGQVLSREQIREAALGWDSDADDAAISMHVSRARKKLACAGVDPIATVWGWGTNGNSEAFREGDSALARYRALLRLRHRCRCMRMGRLVFGDYDSDKRRRRVSRQLRGRAGR